MSVVFPLFKRGVSEQSSKSQVVYKIAELFKSSNDPHIENYVDNILFILKYVSEILSEWRWRKLSEYPMTSNDVFGFKI